ncbi:unnamed protein product [Calicophoron daubneyi]|uniref:Uncharacterized protein n=1 Tax=Calicophoron daubneyi TaxID=300641 RepID=A0AAV2TF31_CALDB
MRTEAIFLGALFALGTPYLIFGDKWAVLVAGSKGWENYRHQSDVTRAYSILTSHGIPERNIITMLYGDIFSTLKNKKKSSISYAYNQSVDFQNLTIDFRGSEVTAKNFVYVLLQSKILKFRNKKVLESGPSDDVFIYFSGLGSRGMILFPNGYLYAASINAVLKRMHYKNYYKRLVFYIEAGYSGSLFEGRSLDQLNVHILTAASASESSLGTLCDGLNNTPCLTNEFSSAWMNLSSEVIPPSRTLSEQYELIRRKVHGSQVKKYGGEKLDKDLVVDFLGNLSIMKTTMKPTVEQTVNPITTSTTSAQKTGTTGTVVNPITTSTTSAQKTGTTGTVVNPITTSTTSAQKTGTTGTVVNPITTSTTSAQKTGTTGTVVNPITTSTTSAQKTGTTGTVVNPITTSTTSAQKTGTTGTVVNPITTSTTSAQKTGTTGTVVNPITTSTTSAQKTGTTGTVVNPITTSTTSAQKTGTTGTVVNPITTSTTSAQKTGTTGTVVNPITTSTTSAQKTGTTGTVVNPITTSTTSAQKTGTTGTVVNPITTSTTSAQKTGTTGTVVNPITTSTTSAQKTGTTGTVVNPITTSTTSAQKTGTTGTV